MTDDEQEAGSRKYVAPQVVPLRSGNFAIYNLYTIANGLQAHCICSEAELPNILRQFVSAIDEDGHRQEAEMAERLANPRVSASRVRPTLDSLLEF